MTLIETLVATAIFLAVAVSVYQLYNTVLNVSRTIRAKTVMTEITSEQIEFIRNLKYSDVGTIGGIPSGVVPQNMTITRNNMTFALDITIRSIDNPADGTLGGIPNDLSPADNKLVEVDAVCTSCQRPASTFFSSIVAPKNLETENGNGVLVIKAVDANGQPVINADVTIVNTSLSPSVNITDTTGDTGTLTIVDAPPSVQGYKIIVTKAGYSTDQTYPSGGSGNPTPSKINLTVVANKITQASFAIDMTSSLTVKTQSAQCAALANISGTLSGAKLIGSPNVLKNSIAFTTSGSGSATLSGIDWDTYSVSVGGNTYSVAGTNPISPVSITPNSNQQYTITLKPALPNRLVIGVVDSTGLPLADADVSITGPSGTFSGNTNVGSVTQTDWLGGSGQVNMSDWTKFFSNDSGLEYNVTGGGTIRLSKPGSTYSPNGSLISSTIDFGDVTTFRQLSWVPITQPSGIGSTPVAFQIATNTDNATWNFIGPDGTSGSYYTSTPADISDVNNGDRYLRYKVILSTTNTSKTPSINDVSITYAAGCLPPGQVDFAGLTAGSYTVTISKTGFATVVKTITISGNAYDTTTLIPN